VLGLSELRGHAVVLNFWASWCPPCRTEAPRLERAWRQARRRGVAFLGLDMQDVSSDARDFLDEFEISYPNVRDPGNDVALDWGLTGLPETFFLRRDGRIVGRVIGAISSDQLRRGLAAALAGRVVGNLAGGERRSTR
jgi:cytochrome c biogenesis protein CcmG/thiol:disulfide interchange protein DsbE